MAKSYLEQRRDMKNGIKPTAQQEKTEKKEIGQFFGEQIKKAKSNCQNCNKFLKHTMKINPAAVVCHILPKRKEKGVPSMAMNESNIIFLCGDCHTNMDNKGAEFVQRMKVYPLLLKRVALMFPHIPDNEKKNIPTYLLPDNLLNL